MMISSQLLIAAIPCPPEVATRWAEPLDKACTYWRINTPKRVAGFLAQVSHESARLTVLEEGLKYTATRLMAVWPRRFPTKEIAAKYQLNPHKLANFVYANRMGNGDEASGDGWAYRGKGPLQITGRDNHEACGLALGLDLVRYPELLLVPENGAMAAGWFWDASGCNSYIDQDNFKAVSQAINGGTVGFQERVSSWNMVKQVMGLA